MIYTIKGENYIDTDKFTDLPHSAQALYFHLGRRKEMKGMINNRKAIARAIRAGEKDIENLVNAGFLAEGPDE